MFKHKCKFLYIGVLLSHIVIAPLNIARVGRAITMKREIKKITKELILKMNRKGLRAIT